MAVTLEQRRMRSLAAQQLQQRFAESGGGGGREDSLPAAGADDCEAVLALAEVLAVSKNLKVRMFAASLYQTVFRRARFLKPPYPKTALLWRNCGGVGVVGPNVATL